VGDVAVVIDREPDGVPKRRGEQVAPFRQTGEIRRTARRRPMSITMELNPGRSETMVVVTLPSNAVAFQSKFRTSMRWWIRS
jgi:hypothetical protein